MKKYIIITIIGFLFALPLVSNAQCKSFAKTTCKPELAPFIHDGIYNAAVAAEGETIELYKTFYSGQDYRLIVCGEDVLPGIEFQVLDSDRNILFDNTESGTDIWDFNLTASQMLTISIQVNSSDEMSDDIVQGCVSVLIGFKNTEEQAVEEK